MGWVWVPARVSTLPSLDFLRSFQDHFWEKGDRYKVGLLLISLVINLCCACLDCSDARERFQSLMGRGDEDTAADQYANEWGRSGKDPNHFRPDGLPSKY